METFIGEILLVGVILSVICLAAGEIWRWSKTGSPTLDYALAGHSIAGFIREEIHEMLLGHFRPRFFVNVGLALLLMTPYARVLASLLYFAFIERNAKYVAFTSIVLGVLTYSLFGR